jgi:protein-export membrane protein SecD
MKRNWWLSFSFLLVIVMVSIAMVIPTVFRLNDDSKYPIKSKINLGLDLQGGLYLILGIDFKKVYRDEVTNYLRKIEFSLGTEKVVTKLGDFDLTDPLDPKQSLIVESPADLVKVKEYVKKNYANYIRLTNETGNQVQFALMTTLKTQIEEQSVSKSIEVIRNRIDEFGVNEPDITSQGNDRIVVQLPGVRDIDRAKELIGKTARLEFKIVNDSTPPATVEAWVEDAKKAGIEIKKGEKYSDYLFKLNDFLKTKIPEGSEIAFQKTVSKMNNEIEKMIPYLVEKNTKLTGDDLQDAYVQIDQQKNEPYVGLNFKTNGAKMFEDITANNIGKRMAVILDGNVYTAPNIQTKIAGGRAQITLGFGKFDQVMKQARDIALVLRAGALPVQLDFLEQRVVGPSLGLDSIHKAGIASIIACAAVFLFSLIYYRIAGGIAVLTLLINVLITVACLIGIGATLTLPGIAGIALTVGMAVDGNIIIYERIREEKHLGVGNYAAVDSGFAAAFWSIIDANITTALAGICLLNFGTGPIRGFAVTLLIGIMATVYCSFFVSKLFFDLYMSKVEGQELSI